MTKTHKHDHYPPSSEETKEHTEMKTDFPGKANAVDVKYRKGRKASCRGNVHASTHQEAASDYIYGAWEILTEGTLEGKHE